MPVDFLTKLPEKVLSIQCSTGHYGRVVSSIKLKLSFLSHLGLGSSPVMTLVSLKQDACFIIIASLHPGEWYLRG